MKYFDIKMLKASWLSLWILKIKSGEKKLWTDEKCHLLVQFDH